jgi:hypothetical protein
VDEPSCLTEEEKKNFGIVIDSSLDYKINFNKKNGKTRRVTLDMNPKRKTVDLRQSNKNRNSQEMDPNEINQPRESVDGSENKDESVPSSYQENHGVGSGQVSPRNKFMNRLSTSFSFMFKNEEGKGSFPKDNQNLGILSLKKGKESGSKHNSVTPLNLSLLDESPESLPNQSIMMEETIENTKETQETLEIGNGTLPEPVVDCEEFKSMIVSQLPNDPEILKQIYLLCQTKK